MSSDEYFRSSLMITNTSFLSLQLCCTMFVHIAQCVKPLRIWEIKKLVPWPPFSALEIISDRNIWVNIFC